MKKADTVFIFDPRVHMKLKTYEKLNLDDIEKFEQYQWFVDVSKLVSGSSFGELALLNNEPRAATIKCLTNCSFATLNSEEYKSFLQKIEIKQ